MLTATEEYCKHYEATLQEIRGNNKITEQEKIIIAIIKVYRDIQFTHPFVDGNARTISILTNGLLKMHGLSPTIIPDVNVFDCFDIESFVKITKTGQEDFQKHRQHT